MDGFAVLCRGREWESPSPFQGRGRGERFVTGFAQLTYLVYHF